MKKLVLPAALLLTALGSWAFYPKPTESAGYVMVISRFSGSGFNAKNSLTVVMPNGEV